MTPDLLVDFAIDLAIDCGVAQTRACLFIDGVASGFFFAPARGDEAEARAAQAGEVRLARVRSAAPALGGVFLDIGEAREAFAPVVKGAPALREGAAAIVRVRRPAIGTKGAVVAADWQRGRGVDEIAGLAAAAAAATPPARLGPTPDAAMEVFDSARRAAAGAAPGRALRVFVNDVAAGRLLAAAGASVEPEPRPFARILGREEAGETASAALAGSLQREEALPGGARFLIDEAEGACVIDIDSGGAGDGAGRRAAARVNAAAIAALFPMLGRRGIGGQVVVDFLAPGPAVARSALADSLAAAARGAVHPAVYSGGGDWRVAAVTAGGLAVLIGPKEGPTLLERATEPAAGGEGCARMGRRHTPEWLAVEAVFALENVLRRAPSARPRLRLGARLAGVVAARPLWTQRLAARYGARFTIEPANGDTFSPLGAIVDEGGA